MKRNKGITLITLIITIIVMVILAGVAISMAVGDSGVITRGETANATMEQKNIEETIQTSYYYDKDHAGELDYYSTKEAIKNNLEAAGYTVSFDNGTDFPITVTAIGKTGEYTYAVNQIGKMAYTENNTEGNGNTQGPNMSEEQLQQLELLRTYFLGEIDEETGERPGGNLATLIQEPTLDKVLTADPNEIKLRNQAPIIDAYDSITVISNRDDEEGYAALIRYNNSVYRLILETNFTINSVDLLYENSDSLGKYVRYDNKLWRILYNDSINGLQMISEEILEYNENGFRLGHTDSLITDWTTLDTETIEFQLADLDANEILDNDLEKSIYSYNNAIETLNTVCEKIVTPSNNIIDVRCVGSNPTDKNNENTTLYESERAKELPISTSGIGNKKGYSIDYNYTSDWDRMIALGIDIFSDVYWMASRTINEGKNSSGKDTIYFNVRYISDTYNNLTSSNVWGITESSAYGGGSSEPWGLRPVVVLKSDIQFSGAGTEENPYILNNY